MPRIHTIIQPCELDAVRDENAFLWIGPEEQSSHARMKMVTVRDDGEVWTVPNVAVGRRDKSSKARIPVVKWCHGIQRVR